MLTTIIIAINNSKNNNDNNDNQKLLSHKTTKLVKQIEKCLDKSRSCLLKKGRRNVQKARYYWNAKDTRSKY